MRKLFIAALFAAVAAAAPLFGIHGVASAAQTVKPIVVRIEASWCPACRASQATFDRIRSQYAGKAQFVVLDVSDAKSAAESEALAKRLGIQNFFDNNKTATSLVATINPRTHAVVGTVYNDTNLSDYQRLIASALKSR